MLVAVLGSGADQRNSLHCHLHHQLLGGRPAVPPCSSLLAEPVGWRQEEEEVTERRGKEKGGEGAGRGGGRRRV